MGNKDLSKLKVACLQLQVLKRKERLYKCSLVKSACSYLLIKKAEEDDKAAGGTTTPATSTTTEPPKSDDPPAIPPDENISKFGLGNLDEVRPWEAMGNDKDTREANQAYVTRKQDWSGYDSTFGRLIRSFLETDEHRKNAILYMTRPEFMNNPAKMKEYLQKYGVTDPDMQKAMIAEATRIRNSWAAAVRKENEALGKFNRAGFDERLKALDDERQKLYEEAAASGINLRKDNHTKRKRRPYDYSQYDIMADAFGYAGFPYNSKNWMTDTMLEYDDALAGRIYKQLAKRYKYGKPGMPGMPGLPYGMPEPDDNIIDVTATDPNSDGLQLALSRPQDLMRRFNTGTGSSTPVYNEDQALRNYDYDLNKYEEDLRKYKDIQPNYDAIRSYYEDAVTEGIAEGKYPIGTTPEEVAAADGVVLKEPVKPDPNADEYKSKYERDLEEARSYYEDAIAYGAYPPGTTPEEAAKLDGTSLEKPELVAGPARSPNLGYGPFSYTSGRTTIAPMPEVVDYDADANADYMYVPSQEELKALAEKAEEAAKHKNRDSVEAFIAEAERMFPGWSNSAIFNFLAEKGLIAAEFADAVEQSYKQNRGLYEDNKNIFYNWWNGYPGSPTAGVQFNSTSLK